jgi:hypothetical protein
MRTKVKSDPGLVARSIEPFDRGLLAIEGNTPAHVAVL